MQHAALTRQQQHALPLLAYRPHRSVPHEEMETKRRAHGPQPKLDSTGWTLTDITEERRRGTRTRRCTPWFRVGRREKPRKTKAGEDTVLAVEAAALLAAG